MDSKYFLLATLLISASLMSFNSAYAHKSVIVGDYKIEIGWDKEPPVVGVDNSITVMISHASDEEKMSSEMNHGDMEHSDHDKESDHMTHDESDHAAHDEESMHEEGISGLASAIDMSVTLNNKKTTLAMTEDEHITGLYHGKFVPSEPGYPTVSFFAEIDGTPVETTLHPEKVQDGALIKAVSSDGTVNVDVIATAPAQDQQMLLGIDFTDSQGNQIEHVNYALTVTQAGTNVLSHTEGHAHTGTASHSTNPLLSNAPVDVQVTILGIGLPDNKAEWTGPKDDMIPIHVTPEFGPIVMVVMGIALLSLVGLARKSKILPNLNR